MSRSVVVRIVLALAMLLWPAHQGMAQSRAAPNVVDLRLVLAVDISLSMDPDEQRLQRDGYVIAFADQQLINAIRGGRHGRIAVTYFEWAGPEAQQILVPWRVIDGEPSARAFSEELATKPYTRQMRTSISSALLFARQLFAASPYRSERNVIDVSGDGVNNSGPLMAATRASLLAEGFVINGLPIMTKPTREWTLWDAPDLDLYYGKCVVGGPGSFMVPILKPEEFATATRQKLLLEIGAAPAARIVRVQQTVQPDFESYDCGVVERRIERRQWER